MTEERLVGRVSHYYDNIGVAIVDLDDNLVVGQTVHFKGASDDFTETVDQMQIDHEDVVFAPAGYSVGLKVHQKLHENDKVFAQ